MGDQQNGEEKKKDHQNGDKQNEDQQNGFAHMNKSASPDANDQSDCSDSDDT